MKLPISPARLRNQKGISFLVLSIMITSVLIPIVGLAIDGGILFLSKAKLQSAVDGGAIAAGRSLSAGLTFGAQKAAAIRTVQQFVTANFPQGYQRAGAVTYSPDINIWEDNTVSLRRRVIEVNAHIQVPLYFMRLLGTANANVGASAVAARRDVRLVLVLDRSSSMSPAIAQLRSNALTFVQQFQAQRDQLGLVVFGGSAIVAYPPRDPSNPDGGGGPDADFATRSSSNMLTLIPHINAGSNTGMAEALWLAYKELTKNPLPGALNAILLFTDGLPNGLAGYWNAPGASLIKTTSTCSYKQAADSDQQMRGWIAQVSGFANVNNKANGIFRLMQRDTGNTDVDWYLRNPSESQIPDTAKRNCYYAGSSSSIGSDLSTIPAQDMYGNAIAYASDPPYRHSRIYTDIAGGEMDRTKVTNAYQVGLASYNAVDSAVTRIRAEPNNLKILIYCIGYTANGEPPDTNLMKRIANTSDSLGHSSDTNNPTGRYVVANNPAQLAQAFASIASEILHLTQ